MSKMNISQTVAVLIDGNNMELSIKDYHDDGKIRLLDFDKLIPKLIGDRSLNRLKYFREGRSISRRLAERLHRNFYGVVIPCHKSADIPLTIEATQLADKVDTIIILSGDADYVELVNHLKSRGVRVEIASFRKTTSNVLIGKADYNYFINSSDIYTLKSKEELAEENETGDDGDGDENTINHFELENL